MANSELELVNEKAAPPPTPVLLDKIWDDNLMAKELKYVGSRYGNSHIGSERLLLY
jgi:hypothetical protein